MRFPEADQGSLFRNPPENRTEYGSLWLFALRRVDLCLQIIKGFS
jgi:hypothetical protein